MSTIPASFAPSADQLAGKVILVTGATGGFGRVISHTLAEHGATVILLARNLRLVEALYDEIEKAGFPQPAIYPMNLEGACESDYTDLATNIEKEFGHLDGLIHCAALLGSPTVFEHSDLVSWDRVHQVNLRAPYLLTRACLPLMKKADKASLLFITDDKSGAYWDAYQVTKKALEGMAGLLAREYAGTHLYVNCYRPGKTRTALQISAYPGADDNDSLPGPELHRNAFVYFMSDHLSKNGQIFSA